jgi:hypothetical protein
MKPAREVNTEKFSPTEGKIRHLKPPGRGRDDSPSLSRINSLKSSSLA